MLAAYATTTGGPDPVANLEVGRRPLPKPKGGWALVRVGAAALNHHDLWTLRGISAHPIAPPQILGGDAAGTVEAYGTNRPDGAPAIGTRVVIHSVVGCGHCAACRLGQDMYCADVGLLSEGSLGGTLAERVAVPAANLIPLPDSVTFTDAACLPTSYLTAYRMLFVRALLRPGMKVLVHGATGGVATAAILLAKAAGIVVIATSRDEEKRQFAVEQLGAVAAIAPDRAAARTIQEVTDGGVDAVIETVGEPTWEVSLRAVRPGGAIVVAGATGGANPPARLNHIFWRQIQVLGSSMGTRAELAQVVSLCANTGLRPRIDSVMPLDKVEEAFRRLEAGVQRGKIVILPGGG